MSAGDITEEPRDPRGSGVYLTNPPFRAERVALDPFGRPVVDGLPASLHTLHLIDVGPGFRHSHELARRFHTHYVTSHTLWGYPHQRVRCPVPHPTIAKGCRRSVSLRIPVEHMRSIGLSVDR